VTVPHGQTLLLGGIIREQNTDSVDRVPLLGRLPGLGKAFRSTNKDRTRTELLLAITPTIANEPSDAAPMVSEFVRSAASLQEALRDFKAPVSDALIIADHQTKRHSTRNDASPAFESTGDPSRSAPDSPLSLRRLALVDSETAGAGDDAQRAVSAFLRRLSDRIVEREREG